MTLTFIKNIGFGGFGNVDLVEDEVGNRFARKTFSKNQPLDDDLLANVLKRFIKEVRVQGGIDHPNIVPILESNLVDYPPSYLMPVALGSLAEEIQKNRTLNGNFVSAISDIVAALEELHAIQIYHRDLKPQNVLRFGATQTGSDSYAVSDFGLISLRESRLSVLTRTGMIKGSDYYTAPEIAKDLRQASAQSDIYSLGCILHDMIGTEDRVPCGEIREPGDFAGILLGCTRTKPADRFKSVRAVLDAILSLEFAPTVIPSAEAATFVNKLSSSEELTQEDWRQMADFLDFHASREDKIAILRGMTSDRIVAVGESSQVATDSIGSHFAEWIETSAFNFDSCDALANRLEDFFDQSSFQTKVDCLMAMLEMGISHNRWYVERKFLGLCGHDMDPSLAKRLAIEFRIRDKKVCRQIEKWETSIDTRRSFLHPSLVAALNDICK